MVLADCLTVESLDALVPAVEQLVEGLVPYFQHLLWDLPDHQQAIIRRLAEGDSAALTAADIAAGTGQSPQTVSKALQVLQEGRWVRAEKIPTDRRKTWYSLREPMLRHHFRWRAARGEPLTLIVELLRGWYSPRTLTGGEDFGTEVIELLAESTEPPTGPALLVNLWGALLGDAQAEVQLPAELREVVRQRASRS